MYINDIDVSKCDRADKEVIEGFCLSYDMIKGVCLETMCKCKAEKKTEESRDAAPGPANPDMD